MKNKLSLSDDKICAYWLLACAALVFIMCLVGAATRLTESGLSITEWRPITGTLPPLTDTAWLLEFSKYRASPEYFHKNLGMSLSEFKYIYYWEWAHRLLARVIGLAYGLPLLLIWLTHRIPTGYGRKLIGLLALGSLQGVAGWWMVTSGLIDNPNVSHYRLAVHLSLAILIFVGMFWMALTLLKRDGALITPPIAHNTPGLRAHGYAALALITITIIWGAFVAGLSAGLIYNEWPLMGKTLMPEEMWHLTPHIINIFENHAAVQFTHRWIAIAAVFAVITFAWRMNAPFLAAVMAFQLCLGIATLLSGVPVWLGTLHQGGALLTLTALLFQMHRLTYGDVPPAAKASKGF